MHREEQEKLLRSVLVDEITRTLGFKGGGKMKPVIGFLSRRATNRLIEISLDINEEVDKGSLNSAFAKLLHLFSDPPIVRGVEDVPAKGPLLLTCNHPGTVDTAVLLSSVPRPDTKIISGYTPYTDNLVHIRKHLIYSTTDAHQRMSVVRESIRHLKDGGCLLLYPAGALEPDPAIIPGAIDYMKFWHRSVEIFVKRVPDIVVSPIVASHILLPRFYNHFIARMRKQQKDRQRAAEMLQIVSAIINRDKNALTPRVTFGKGFTLEDLNQNVEGEGLFDSIKQISADLMEQHVASFDHEHPPLRIAAA